MHEITLGEDLGTSSYIGGGTISEAFCRILYFDPLSEQFSSDNDAMNFEKGRSALWEPLALHISHFRSLQDRYDTCPTGSALDLDLQVYNRSLIMSEDGYIGLAPNMVETGDELCIFLGCGAPMLLRSSDDACFQVIGVGYVVGLRWGEGFLGPIAQDWVPASRFSADGRDAQAFFDPVSKTYTKYDPRLGDLPDGWETVRHDQEEFYSQYRYINTGETTWLDPRLSPRELRKRGVELRLFSPI